VGCVVVGGGAECVVAGGGVYVVVGAAAGAAEVVGVTGAELVVGATGVVVVAAAIVAAVVGVVDVALWCAFFLAFAFAFFFLFGSFFLWAAVVVVGVAADVEVELELLELPQPASSTATPRLVSSARFMIKLPLSLDDFGSRVQEVPVDGGRTHAPASACEAGRHREDSGGRGYPRVPPGAGGREYVLYNGRALHAHAPSRREGNASDELLRDLHSPSVGPRPTL
jgi:hypothetical protein